MCVLCNRAEHWINNIVCHHHHPHNLPIIPNCIKSCFLNIIGNVYYVLNTCPETKKGARYNPCPWYFGNSEKGYLAIISTLRFWLRPSLVSLEATG